MSSVRIHIDGKGVVWFLARCRQCYEIHKYLATDVDEEGTQCKSCGNPIGIRGATIDGLARSAGDEAAP